ncbi:MAG: nucleotidyltransferase domain-containing protein [Candidatus Cloacimonadota bacterium]|nr:nucleotidyltransferase domain-containing protein [Candidatus Cloacimonadota bacterium]
MRLTKKYIYVIKESFSKVFQDGEIYLFGSRVDDTKRGGDIDLYLIVDNKINLFRKKLKFLAKIKRVLGEQKIDVIFNIDNNRLIEREAQQWGIKL